MAAGAFGRAWYYGCDGLLSYVHTVSEKPNICDVNRRTAQTRSHSERQETKDCAIFFRVACVICSRKYLSLASLDCRMSKYLDKNNSGRLSRRFRCAYFRCHFLLKLSKQLEVVLHFAHSNCCHRRWNGSIEEFPATGSGLVREIANLSSPTTAHAKWANKSATPSCSARENSLVPGVNARVHMSLCAPLQNECSCSPIYHIINIENQSEFRSGCTLECGSFRCNFSWLILKGRQHAVLDLRDPIQVYTFQDW